MKPKLLDLYCCQGGASAGYVAAGFDVFGIDISAQPHYPFPFYMGDVLVVVRRLLLGEAIPFREFDGAIEWLTLSDFDAIHASPPCQLYSLTHRINRSDFPDLIGPTREILLKTALPFVIENVMDAAPEMRGPVMLCGAMFGIETYRHRLFESSFELQPRVHPAHTSRTTKMGRAPVLGEYMHVVGNFSGVAKAREVMGMPWATRDGLREAIPPRYAEFVGLQIMSKLKGGSNGETEVARALHAARS